MRNKYLWYFCVLLLLKSKSVAQCCSANPIVGSSNIGLLSKNTLREILFYRYSFSDTYFEKSSKRENIHYLQYSLYSYAGNIVSYGITHRFTADFEFGYYIKKEELTDASRKFTVNGLNNGVVSLKYGLIKKPTFECTIGAGLKFPFTGQLKEADGRPLSVSLQTSTNAFGAVFLVFLQKSFESQFRLFLIHRAEIFNGYNKIYYMKGNTFFTTLFLSKSLGKSWSLLLQIRNEIRGRDYWYDKAQAGTGGVLLFISPQINYNIKGFNFSLLYDMPVYRYVNEQQIVSKYSISLICTKDFNF